MILTVKPLQGKECSVQVTEDEKVSTVKELVSERLNIPANQQRLLYKGKALADEHRLSDYSIGPEAKLNLVIRPVGERTGASGTAASSSSSTQGRVWQTVSTILARHFSPADAAKVHEQLIKGLGPPKSEYIFKSPPNMAKKCSLLLPKYGRHNQSIPLKPSDYERSLRQLSLDDIERLAGRLLHPDGEGMDTSYMD